MRIDAADPVRDLLVIYGGMVGVLFIIALLIVTGAACESLWKYIVSKFTRRPNDS